MGWGAEAAAFDSQGAPSRRSAAGQRSGAQRREQRRACLFQPSANWPCRSSWSVLKPLQAQQELPSISLCCCICANTQAGVEPGAQAGAAAPVDHAHRCAWRAAHHLPRHRHLRLHKVPPAGGGSNTHTGCGRRLTSAPASSRHPAAQTRPRISQGGPRPVASCEVGIVGQRSGVAKCAWACCCRKAVACCRCRSAGAAAAADGRRACQNRSIVWLSNSDACRVQQGREQWRVGTTQADASRASRQSRHRAALRSSLLTDPVAGAAAALWQARCCRRRWKTGTQLRTGRGLPGLLRRAAARQRWHGALPQAAAAAGPAGAGPPVPPPGGVQPGWPQIEPARGPARRSGCRAAGRGAAGRRSLPLAAPPRSSRLPSLQCKRSTSHSSVGLKPAGRHRSGRSRAAPARTKRHAAAAGDLFISIRKALREFCPRFSWRRRRSSRRPTAPAQRRLSTTCPAASIFATGLILTQKREKINKQGCTHNTARTRDWSGTTPLLPTPLLLSCCPLLATALPTAWRAAAGGGRGWQGSPRPAAPLLLGSRLPPGCRRRRRRWRQLQRWAGRRAGHASVGMHTAGAGRINEGHIWALQRCSDTGRRRACAITVQHSSGAFCSPAPPAAPRPALANAAA